MKTYNKLVRDKIPQIIEEADKICRTRIMDDREYYDALLVKLQEELDEFINSGEIEEIADLLEVIRAILQYRQVSLEQVEQIRIEKAEKRGSFDQKIFLIDVED